jgi:hypothetical protein
MHTLMNLIALKAYLIKNFELFCRFSLTWINAFRLLFKNECSAGFVYAKFCKSLNLYTSTYHVILGNLTWHKSKQDNTALGY